MLPAGKAGVGEGEGRSLGEKAGEMGVRPPRAALKAAGPVH